MKKLNQEERKSNTQMEFTEAMLGLYQKDFYL
jgi:hypothetical protein